MDYFTAKVPFAPPEAAVLTLTWEQRQHSRLRLVLADGQEIGLGLPRGTLLADGDGLVREDGQVTRRVVAAVEPLSRVECSDGLTLARAAYHLGNRHVPLQIEREALYYLQDAVLDDLVRGLGLFVTAVQRPFIPENGAYQGGGHSHHSHPHEQGRFYKKTPS